MCTCWCCVCVFVSVLSRRGDGLHMQSVFTALKEIMTMAENPPAISLRSHLSVSLCACILCEGLCLHTRCTHVCVWACVHYLCKPACVPWVIFVSALARTVYHTHLSVTSAKWKYTLLPVSMPVQELCVWVCEHASKGDEWVSAVCLWCVNC